MILTISNLKFETKTDGTCTLQKTFEFPSFKEAVASLGKTKGKSLLDLMVGAYERDLERQRKKL